MHVLFFLSPVSSPPSPLALHLLSLLAGTWPTLHRRRKTCPHLRAPSPAISRGTDATVATQANRCSVFFPVSDRLGHQWAAMFTPTATTAKRRPLGRRYTPPLSTVRPPATPLRLPMSPLFVLGMKALLGPVLCAATRTLTTPATTALSPAVNPSPEPPNPQFFLVDLIKWEKDKATHVGSTALTICVPPEWRNFQGQGTFIACTFQILTCLSTIQIIYQCYQ